MDKITELVRLISDSLDRVENSIVSFLKGISETIFRVKVENQPEDIKVNNLSELADKLDALVATVKDELKLVKTEEQSPLKKIDVNVTNPTTHVAIDNLPEPIRSVEMANIDVLRQGIDDIKLALEKPLKLDHTTPENKLAVRLVDSLDEFYDAVFKGTNSGGIISAVDRLAPLLVQIRQAIENIDINIDVGELTVAMDDLEELNGRLVYNVWGEQTLAANGTIVLASFTVPTGKILHLKQIHAEGKADGEFWLEIDNVITWRGRNSWSGKGIDSPWEIDVDQGKVVELLVKNVDHETVLFSGGFYGYGLTRP